MRSLGYQIAFALLLPTLSTAQPALWSLEKVIALRYPWVPQLESDSLAKRLAIPDDSSLLLFDTRPPEEYAVSRLRGAIRLDPDMGAEQFVAAYRDTLQNRDLVFYCSVGYRSSTFIMRIMQAIDSTGYSSIANLRGGLFRWHNEDRPLHAKTQVDTVHPFNEHWGKFLKKKRAP